MLRSLRAPVCRSNRTRVFIALGGSAQPVLAALVPDGEVVLGGRHARLVGQGEDELFEHRVLPRRWCALRRVVPEVTQMGQQVRVEDGVPLVRARVNDEVARRFRAHAVDRFELRA